MTHHRLKPVTVLISLVVAMLTLSALQAPAGAAGSLASATKRTLSISAHPNAAVVGKTVAFSGVLSKSPKGSKLTIQRRVGSSWVTAKSTKTSTAAGKYSVRVAVPSFAGTYSYRATAASSGALAPATSPTIKVSALTAVYATIKAAPSTLTAGANTVLSGTVKPFVKDTVVTFQKFAGTTWTGIGVSAVLSAKGTFSKAVQVKDGSVYRVSVPRKGLLAPAVSAGTPVVANPAISSTSLPAGSVGSAYSAQLTQVGSRPGTWSVTPALPNGLSLNTSTGKITGTPTAVSNGNYQFSLAQPGLVTANKSLHLSVTAPVPPTITTSTLPAGVRGTAYSTTLTAQGSPSGTWTAAPLPAGLSLAAATGVISGTPTAAGTTHVVIGFTQTNTGLAATPKNLDLVVNTPPPPTISTTSLPTGQKNSSYTTTLTAQNSPAGTWTASPLPAGLSLAAATGVISGTPTTAGTTQVMIGFTQTSTGVAATPKTLPLVINPPPAPSIRTTSLPDAVQLSSYQATLVASGGATGTWSLAAGSLPVGISLNTSTGVISGTPVATGTSTPTFGFTDSDGTATPVKLKLQVLAVGSQPNAVIAAAGGSSSCRIAGNQTLSCWGADDAGQLGNGGVLVVDPPAVATPTQVGVDSDWTAISISDDSLPGEGHVCGLRGTKAYCWGSDVHGMLGTGVVNGANTSPVPVNGGFDWTSITAGFTNSCGVTTGGKLYCWGDNSFGQLGTGTGDVAVPTQVGTDTDWESVSSGYTSSCAIKTNGSLFCWGSNTRGQLGTGNFTSEPTPTQVGTGTWTSVSVSSGFACARNISGAISCWGASSNGQLGNGVTTNDSSTDVNSPLQIGSATDWTTLRTGGSYACATNFAGQLWCWGYDGSYQLGDNATGNQSTPERIGTATDWASVDAGQSHSCAVKTNGDVYCWGSNYKGEDGTNSANANVQVPTKVAG